MAKNATAARKPLPSHPYANIFPMMGEADRAELKASMQARGFDPLAPIVMFEGQILDGRNRESVAIELGITPKYVTPKLTKEGALAFVLGHNLARRHLTASQRAMVAATLVTAQRGRGGGKKSATLPIITAYEAASRLGISPRSVTAAIKIRKSDAEMAEAVEKGDMTIADAERRARGKAHVTKATGNEEWGTDDEILAAVRDVLGTIDFDPASAAWANARVKARRYFDKATNGLVQVWMGRGFMNPPFTVGVIDKFVEKWIGDWNVENIDEGIVFVNNATDTAWCQALLTHATAVCFPRGRRACVAPDGTQRSGALQGQAIFYFGANPVKFCERFRVFGATGPLVPISGPRAVPAPVVPLRRAPEIPAVDPRQTSIPGADAC